MFFPYVYTTVDIFVVTIGITSYVCIYVLYRKSKTDTRKHSTYPLTTPGHKKERVSKRFMFLVPMSLIISYILLQLIPNVIYLWATRTETRLSPIIMTCCNIAYALSHFIDAVIYIFLLDNVRVYVIKCLGLPCSIERHNSIVEQRKFQRKTVNRLSTSKM